MPDVIWKPSASGATSSNLIVGGGTARGTPKLATPCTAIGVAFGARAANACCGFAASDWNGRLRISTKPTG